MVFTKLIFYRFNNIDFGSVAFALNIIHISLQVNVSEYGASNAFDSISITITVSDLFIILMVFVDRVAVMNGTPVTGTL